MAKSRCEWAQGEAMTRYHDQEWGAPTHDDRDLFEFLVLEGAQAGLSWETILKKRPGYRDAFDNFDVHTVAGYDETRIETLLANPRIVRNRRKIESAITNARAFLSVQAEFESFDAYVWAFVDGRPIRNAVKALSEMPAKTEISDRLSADLKRRGFSFVGSTICYAFMQAAGLVNDHTADCFRYGELSASLPDDGRMLSPSH
ncbi:MAG: DNA-3-methyladenine glycosylase I [Dehalococcoidia bacterium]